MKQKRILITRTDRLGDVVLTTPVIRFFREYYPSAHIAFMVGPSAEDVIKNDPYLDEIIVYDKKGEHRSPWKTFLFAMKLRNKKFDVAIAMHPENRIHAVLFLAGIPLRIGYQRKWWQALTQPIEHKKQEGLKHEVDYNFDLLRKAGFDTKNAKRFPYIITGEAESKKIDALFEEHGINKQIIALHAGASCPSKRWAPERFSEVCNILLRDQGFSVVLVGGKETMEISKKVISGTKGKIHDLTGLLSVGELAEVLARSKVFISNDSGPVHISVAVGTPVVSIFGRRSPGLSPKRWGPLGPKDIVLHKDTLCSECLAHNCKNDNECLLMITVDEVVKAVRKILASN